MKKLFSLLFLALAVPLALAACGGQDATARSAEGTDGTGAEPVEAVRCLPPPPWRSR